MRRGEVRTTRSGRARYGSLRAIVGTSLVLLALALASARAGVEEVTVRVDGLACPFCAYNVEKRVRRLRGIPPGTRIVTSDTEGTSRFSWDAAIPFDPERVRRAIRKAGFTPRGLVVRVRGTLRVPDGPGSAPLLEWTAGEEGRALPLVRSELSRHRGTWKALLDLRQRPPSSGGEQVVELSGEVLEPEAGGRGPWRLRVHELRRDPPRAME